MKKVAIIFVMLAIVVGTHAGNDSTKLFQAIKCGIILSGNGYTHFDNIEKPFNLGYTIFANVTAVTPKTYHSLMYNVANTSLCFISGYFLPRDWDAYLVYAKSININNHYLGIGAEKMISAKNVECFLFSEYGIDFMGTSTLTFGVLISTQAILFKRK